jgi:hypothetical protein
MPQSRDPGGIEPLAWLVVAALLAGAASHAALGEDSRAMAKEAASPAPATSGPASPEWNLPKCI